MPAADPVADAIRLLNREGIEYILVSGAAAMLHGSARLTLHVDFCCSGTAENRGRLAQALNSVRAKLRVEGAEGMPVHLEAKYLGQFQAIALITDIGYLDVRKSVDGIGGYDDVLKLSEEYDFGGIAIRMLT